MPVGQDLINFGNSDDWELIVNLSQSVTEAAGSSFIPFGSFDLKVTVDSLYLVGLVTVDYRKRKWDFAGDLVQTYDFTSLSEEDANQRVSIEGIKLFIDEAIFIDAAKVSREPFGLKYTPPTWFKDFNLKVFAYRGEVENAVEATFTEITQDISCNGTTGTEDILQGIQTLAQTVELLEAGLDEKLEAIANACCNQEDNSRGDSQANGTFKPKEEKENLLIAYYRGFL